MPRRTVTLDRIPWLGGVNSSTDSGIIPDTDLVIADNVVFASTGARVKRENWEYWDALSDVPTVTHRESAGTTRTLTFSEKVNEALIDRLVAGEAINVTTTWKFTAPVSGIYQVSAMLFDNASSFSMQLYRNGSLFRAIGHTTTSLPPSNTTSIALLAGDYIDVRGTATITPDAVGGGTVATTNHITITRVGNYA